MKFFTLLIYLAWKGLVLAQSPAIFPEPKVFESTSIRWYVPSSITVQDLHLEERMRVAIIRYFTKTLGTNVVFVQGAADVSFYPIDGNQIDQYQVDITNQIRVGFTTPESKLMAFTTLQQLLQRNEKGLFWNQVHIEDYADYAWRGLHLDVSRHFFPKEDIFWLLDQMAYYKLNTFHWHLTDDQGWRIEIKKYPKLTEIGAVRAQTLVGHASNKPATFDQTIHEGYYSQEDIRAVVRYALNLGITVVPEIEMPGHARAALAAYPEYSCFGKALPVAQKWGVFEQVYCSKPATINFLKDILTEVLDLFPSTYIHIGGDEVPKKHWKSCEACKDVMKSNNLSDEAALQSHFLSQINDFLLANNRKMIGWDEILDGGLPTGAVVMRWRGEEKVFEATESNAFVVQSPNAELYFDHYQSKRADQPLAIGGFSPIEEVYGYQLTPGGLEESVPSLILGGQANVWTEYIPNRKQLEFMLFPRLIALSEILWSEKRPDFESFQAKLIQTGLPRLEKEGIHFSKAIFETKYQLNQTETGLQVEFIPAVPAASTLVTDTEQEMDTKKLEVSASELVENHAFTIQTFLRDEQIDVFELDLLTHPMLGESWEFSNSPNEFYRGDNAFVLTDGIKGRRPWHGAEWLGFRDSVVEISYTWETKKSLSAIHLGMLLAPSSWIYLPDSVEVECSKNGKKWTATTFTPTQENEVFEVDEIAKYVRVRFYNNPSIPEDLPGSGHAAWLFLDEVFFTFKE